MSTDKYLMNELFSHKSLLFYSTRYTKYSCSNQWNNTQHRNGKPSPRNIDQHRTNQWIHISIKHGNYICYNNKIWEYLCYRKNIDWTYRFNLLSKDHCIQQRRIYLTTKYYPKFLHRYYSTNNGHACLSIQRNMNRYKHSKPTLEQGYRHMMSQRIYLSSQHRN